MKGRPYSKIAQAGTGEHDVQKRMFILHTVLLFENVWKRTKSSAISFSYRGVRG